MDRRAVGFAIVASILFWVADAAMDARVHQHASLWEAIVKPASAHELHERLAVVAVSLLAGLGIGGALARQRRHAAARRESERTLMTLMSNLPGMAYRCRNDRDWTMEFVSEGCAELTGFPAADLIGNARVSYNALIHPDDREPVWRAVQAAVTGRQPFELNYRLVRAGGDERNVWERGRGVFTPEGTLAALEGFITDVTKQRRAEQSLRIYTQRLKILREIDTGILAARSPAAIAQAVVERVPRLAPCQRASVALIDLARRELVPLAVWQEGHTEVAPSLRFPLEGMAGELERLRTGAVTEVPDIAETSTFHPILSRLLEEGLRSVVIVPLMAGSDLLGTMNLAFRETRGYKPETIEIAREVAAPLAIAIRQSRLHQQIEREAAELERRVAERTAELQAFAYSVSHDLRSPLRAIDGFAGAIDEECGDRLGQDGRRLLEIVRGNAYAMRQLLDDLLAFYRLGHQDVTEAEIDLDEIAREEFARLREENPGRALHLEVGTLPRAHGDRSMVRLAMVNLLANAVKFTRPRAEGIVEVGSAPPAADAPPAFFVRDNGVGFDPTQVDRLFGVFHRLHPGDEFEGSGVGLAIVKRVVERHGGRVWADGTPDRGATFWFTLPASPSEAAGGAEGAVDA